MPPQSKESNSQDNLDPSKRPKHVVLSDTIQLVRMLQSKVCLYFLLLLPFEGHNSGCVT